jgi:methylated-DNA-protein-cysteine methyltransferase related protein
MTVTPAEAQLLEDLGQLVGRIPVGRLITFGALSARFKTSPRHISTALYALADDAEGALPWHRVVADGGAVGRHPRREEQIRRLQADGVAVSQGGFVQDFARFVILDIAGPMPAPIAVPATPFSRSRGMKDRPS